MNWSKEVRSEPLSALDGCLLLKQSHMMGSCVEKLYNWKIHRHWVQLQHPRQSQNSWRGKDKFRIIMTTNPAGVHVWKRFGLKPQFAPLLCAHRIFRSHPRLECYCKSMCWVHTWNGAKSWWSYDDWLLWIAPCLWPLVCDSWQEVRYGHIHGGSRMW